MARILFVYSRESSFVAIDREALSEPTRYMTGSSAAPA